jgi:hypothetical protein
MSNSGESTAPAGTVTLAGTDAMEGSELERSTTTPPVGAGPVSVTLFPGRVPPPPALAALKAMEDKAGGVIVNVFVRLTPLYVAEIIACVTVLTAEVSIVKLGEFVVFSGTTTVGCGTATGLSLVMDTIAPPTGAGPLRVSLFVVVWVPPVTLLGVTKRLKTVTGLTVSVLTTVDPL